MGRTIQYLAFVQSQARATLASVIMKIAGTCRDKTIRSIYETVDGLLVTVHESV